MSILAKKKQITAAESKIRDPKVFDQYYDLLKTFSSNQSKEVLAQKHDRSVSSINKILVKERKKRIAKIDELISETDELITIMSKN
jgi:hypothetical protein